MYCLQTLKFKTAARSVGVHSVVKPLWIFFFFNLEIYVKKIYEDWRDNILFLGINKVNSEKLIFSRKPPKDSDNDNCASNQRAVL